MLAHNKKNNAAHSLQFFLWSWYLQDTKKLKELVKATTISAELSSNVSYIIFCKNIREAKNLING